MRPMDRQQLNLLETNDWQREDTSYRGVAYRGTESGRGPGIPAYFTSAVDYANKYGSVWEYALNLKKAMVIDAQKHELGGDVEELAYDKVWLRGIKRKGYDGLIIIDGKVTDYVVFSKSGFRLRKKDAYPSYYPDED